MIRFLRYLKGYISFTVSGGFSERFMNLCFLNGIVLWNVKNDGVKVGAFTNSSNFDALKDVAERSGMEFEKCEKLGFLTTLKLHKWRCGALLGGFLAVLSVCVLSGSIWEIEVIGNSTVKASSITESLSEYGVKKGASKRSFDVHEVEKKMMTEYPQFVWISVNVFGGKALVEISEKEEKEKIFDKNEAHNIIAAKDGQIVWVNGLNGTNLVKENDVVTKGQLLISGVITFSDGREKLTNAEGRVDARTVSKNTFRRSFQSSESVIEECRTYYGAELFILKIKPLCFNEPPLNYNGAEYLRSSRETLPAAVRWENTYYCEKRDVSLNETEAKLICLLSAIRKKRRNFSQAEFEKVGFLSDSDSEKLTLSMEIECIENIAVKSDVIR